MKKLTTFVAILLSIAFIMTSVYATESFSITMQMEKNEFSKNEEFTVEFNLSSMQVGEGIISIGATLEYDKESLEVVSKLGQNGWSMTYNDAEGIMLLENNALIKDNGALFKVTFKVKENSKPNLTIRLKDITAAGAGDEISVVNVEKAIVIKSDSSNNGGNNSGDNSGSNSGDNNDDSNNDSNNNNNNSNNNENNNGESSNNGSNNNGNANGNNNQNTISNTDDKNQTGNTTDESKNNVVKIPQTGENDTIIFVLIGVATVLAVISFIRLKMANKSKK